MVETVLARDKNWVRWKLESCPSIVKNAVTPRENEEALAGAKQATANKRMKARPAGAIDVSFLTQSNSAHGLERLKDRSRYEYPRETLIYISDKHTDSPPPLSKI